ncbi:MAG: hypothetical protein WCE61_03195 [Candidatus Acidiferrum sp.]
MTAFQDKSIKLGGKVRMALLGFAVVCAAASPVFGQETVSGKFRLTEKTHLGNAILPAGDFKFSIQPAGNMQTINAIPSAGQAVLVIVRPVGKNSAVTSMFAMARRSSHSFDASKLVLEPVNGGMSVHSMYLDQQGLILDFDWASPSNKRPMLAEAALPGPAGTSKATD